MVEKAKIFYFGVFVLVVLAFIFHVTAMGHHHWKKATIRHPPAELADVTPAITIGLFTKCVQDGGSKQETCVPNVFPKSSGSCTTLAMCLQRKSPCSCDFLPSTKGIAACTIMAAVFLGLAIIILFVHSINTSETRSLGMILGLFPLILLALAFIFILIALILIGSYLSRDMMHTVAFLANIDASNLADIRSRTRDLYKIHIDWSTGLEIISLFFTFLSLILYSAFVFKLGRSP